MNVSTVRLKDYEWASVGRYMRYIESAAELEEINSNSVYSFRINRNPDGLVRKKEAVGHVLTENMRKLSLFVGRNKDGLSREETDVIRSIYKTHAETLKVVKVHIERARKIAASYKASYQASLGFDELMRGGTDNGIF